MSNLLQGHKQVLKIPAGIQVTCNNSGRVTTYAPGRELWGWDQALHYENQITVSDKGDKILVLLIEVGGLDDTIAFLFKDINDYYRDINREPAFAALRNYFYENLDEALTSYFGVPREKVSMVMISRDASQNDANFGGRYFDYKTINTKPITDYIKPLMCKVSFTRDDEDEEEVAAAATSAVAKRSSATAIRGQKRGRDEISHLPEEKAESTRRTRDRKGGKRRKGKMTKRKMMKKRKTMRRKRKMTKR